MDESYRLLLERAKSRRTQIAAAGKRLKKLKPGEIEKLFSELHNEAFENIDCLGCANCCATVGPLVNDQDIERIGRALALKRRDVITEYLREDEEGDLIFKAMPCVFLCADRRCLIYDSRPKACREYPHTDQRYIHRYLSQTVKNSEHCPAVALMFEKLLSDPRFN